MSELQLIQLDKKKGGNPLLKRDSWNTLVCTIWKHVEANSHNVDMVINSAINQLGVIVTK